MLQYITADSYSFLSSAPSCKTLIENVAYVHFFTLMYEVFVNLYNYVCVHYSYPVAYTQMYNAYITWKQELFLSRESPRMRVQGTRKVAQQLRALVTRHEDLILIPRDHKVEPTPTCCLLTLSTCIPTKMHTCADITSSWSEEWRLAARNSDSHLQSQHSEYWNRRFVFHTRPAQAVWNSFSGKKNEWW